MRAQTTTTLRRIGGAAALAAIIAIAGVQARAQDQGGPHEGIKVHGHWTIDIREPDGTLVQHREFDNALQSGGQWILAKTFLRQSSPGEWRVVFTTSSATDFACTFPGAGPSPCFIDEPQLSIAAGPTAGSIALVGSTRATRGGLISEVLARIHMCTPPDQPMADCRNSSSLVFSGTTLATPIPVQLNQSIDVTVIVSFS